MEHIILVCSLRSDSIDCKEKIIELIPQLVVESWLKILGRLLRCTVSEAEGLIFATAAIGINADVIVFLINSSYFR